jgi:hypothetical protein
MLSYGPNLFEFYREAGIDAGKILDGAKPATCQSCSQQTWSPVGLIR